MKPLSLATVAAIALALFLVASPALAEVLTGSSEFVGALLSDPQVPVLETDVRTADGSSSVHPIWLVGGAIVMAVAIAIVAARRNGSTSVLREHLPHH
jgi:hypothetical protein